MVVVYKLLAIPKGETNFIQLGNTMYKSLYEEGHKTIVKSLLRPYVRKFSDYDYVFLFVGFNSEEYYRYATIQLYPKPFKRFSYDNIMERIRNQFSERIRD